MTKEKIAEIAQQLECGMVCFYHRPTGNIDCHPDPYDPYFDPEPWQDLIDKIENNRDDYDRFEKIDSTEGFQVMADFAHSLTDRNFKEKILERLARRRPFQNFKTLIDASEFRQSWFDFKKRAYVVFVKGQVELKK